MYAQLDMVTLEVIRNALPAIANEMAADLQRTSYNMMIYEVRDFCTALVAPDGALVSQNVGGVSHFVADLGVNITDGMVTDSPYEGASLEEWAQRLVNIQTSDGPTLFFNIFLSPAASNGVLFPATDYGLPEPGPQLFRISSMLPPPMIANAQSTGTTVEPGARGFGFNADATMLVRFLEVGTKVDVRD